MFCIDIDCLAYLEQNNRVILNIKFFLKASEPFVKNDLYWHRTYSKGDNLSIEQRCK